MRREHAIWAGIVSVLVLGMLMVMTLLASEPSLLERLAFVGTALGPLVVAGSAILIVWQVREAANAVRGQLFDATSSRILDLNRIFIEYPEIRPYFYDGIDLPPREESFLAYRVKAVAEMHVDFFDTEFLRRRTFPKSLSDLPGFGPWVAGLLRTSPVMCRILHEDIERGEEGWYDEIIQVYSELVADGSAAWMPLPDEE